MELEQRVAAWNFHYRQLGKDVRLKDLDPAEYEKLVVNQLLSVCDYDPQLALAVFRHEGNQGGWLVGSVQSALERMATGQHGVTM